MSENDKDIIPWHVIKGEIYLPLHVIVMAISCISLILNAHIWDGYWNTLPNITLSLIKCLNDGIHQWSHRWKNTLILSSEYSSNFALFGSTEELHHGFSQDWFKRLCDEDKTNTLRWNFAMKTMPNFAIKTKATCLGFPTNSQIPSYIYWFT